MSDKTMQDKIQSLIEQEEDPRERVRLMIMHEIASVLLDNVRAVRTIGEDFAEHQKILTMGRGMWRVVGVVLISGQALVGYLLVDHVGEMKDQRATLHAHAKQLEAINERHRQEERYGARP